MSDDAMNMDLEQLLAQRDQRLKSALKENDSAEGSQNPEMLALAEINYITNFFKSTGAEGLPGRLAQLRALLDSREFTTPQGKEAIKKETDKVISYYRATQRESQESTQKLTLLRFLFLLIGLALLAIAALCLLGGLFIPGVVILLISAYFWGKRDEYKKDIRSIMEAKKQIETAKKIAKVENDSITFLNSGTV